MLLIPKLLYRQALKHIQGTIPLPLHQPIKPLILLILFLTLHQPLLLLLPFPLLLLTLLLLLLPLQRFLLLQHLLPLSNVIYINSLIHMFFRIVERQVLQRSVGHAEV